MNDNADSPVKLITSVHNDITRNECNRQDMLLLILQNRKEHPIP